MNTLVILGKDGLKCLKIAALKGDYDTVKVTGKDYLNADICCTYDYSDNLYVYKFYSNKKHASCDMLAEALGGVGISHRYGIASRRKNFINNISDKYYMLEVDDVIGRWWINIPLRDVSNFPHYLL